MNKKVLLIVMFSVLISCKKENSETKNIEAKIENEVVSKPKAERIKQYRVIKNVVLRSGAGNKFEKVLNEKTSKILKKKFYVTVDNSEEIVIEETKNEWSKVRVVEPDYLRHHMGWMLTKYIIKEDKGNQKRKIDLFNNINSLRSVLSNNGIGQLGSWKKDELGWYSFTDYYSFGNSSSINGMQNNIAYYINGRQKEYANEIKIVLNINNKKENQKALIYLNKIAIRTIENLKLKVPKNLSKSILNQTINEFNTIDYNILLELDKSKINTWNLIINSK